MGFGRAGDGPPGPSAICTPLAINATIYAADLEGACYAPGSPPHEERGRP
jgi:hypothetical protein